MTGAAARDEVSVERDGHVGIATFRRPPHNHFDGRLVEALAAALAALDADPACRAILLRSEGRTFCAGAQFGGDGNGVDAEAAMHVYRGAVALFEVATPIVAAVQGPAVGGGLGLALAADFRVAGERAWFSANFARLGLHSGFGISATLPRVVGLQAASMMLQTGCRVDAAEAARIGLADRLAAQDALDGEALALAAGIASGAPLAVQSMRRTLLGDRAAMVRAAIEREIAEQRVHFQTDDFREGIRAAYERRTPVFAGR